jgi:hypothetical protein
LAVVDCSVVVSIHHRYNTITKNNFALRLAYNSPPPLRLLIGGGGGLSFVVAVVVIMMMMSHYCCVYSTTTTTATANTLPPPPQQMITILDTLDFALRLTLKKLKLAVVEEEDCWR